MFYKSVLWCLLGMFILDLVKTDPTKVYFNLKSSRTTVGNVVNCKETQKKIDKNTYTVIEGDYLHLYVNFNKTVNFVECKSLTGNVTLPTSKYLIVTKMKISRDMDGIFKCKILTLKDVSGFVHVKYPEKNGTFVESFCFMKLHVRMKDPSIRFLMNNIELKTNRNNAPTQEVDYTAVYNYTDGDTFQVTCQIVNRDHSTQIPLIMEYDFGEKINNLVNLSSTTEIGFQSKFNAKHNGKTISCLYKDEYLQIKFRRKQFTNSIGVKINGFNIRPDWNSAPVTFYEITYEYDKNFPILIECEIYVDTLQISMFNATNSSAIVKPKAGEQMKVNKTIRLANHTKIETFRCAADSIKSGPREQVEIHFKPKKVSELYQLSVFLPNMNPFLEIYENDRRFIFYEYRDDMDVILNCSNTLKPQMAFVIYVQILNHNKTIKSKTEDIMPMKLTQGSVVNATCTLYLEEPNTSLQKDKILKTVTVFLIKPIEVESETLSIATTTDDLVSGGQNTTEVPDFNPVIMKETGIHSWVFVVLGSTTCIIVICLSTMFFQMKRGRRSQSGPNNPTYVNIDGTSQASLPVYPTHWAENYAVPADVREDNTTYCVPYRPEQIVYSIPIPKKERKKKQEEPHTYTNVQNSIRKQSNLNEPNYAEIVHNKQPCYAKILPKSQRREVEVSPYAYVTAQDFSNQSGQEPMYCEPQINK